MAGRAKGRLLLLGRPGCHLCEEFRDALQAVLPGVELREACVDDRADWRQRFGAKIPVLLTEDGAVLCETFFDAEKLENWAEA